MTKLFDSSASPWRSPALAVAAALLFSGAASAQSGAPASSNKNDTHGGYSLLDLAQYAAEALGVSPMVRVQALRMGEIRHYVADLSKARELLGYEPLVTLREGISLSIADSRPAPVEPLCPLLSEQNAVTR